MKAILEFRHDIESGTLAASSAQRFVCGDAQAHELRFVALTGEADADLSGATAKAYAILSNRATALADATITGNVIRLTFPADFYSIAGTTDVLLRLLKGGMKYDVLLLRFNVVSGITSTVYDPSGQLPDLSDFQTVIAACEEATEAVTAAGQEASTQAAAASSAASRANTAASSANTAASGARSATSSANTATQAANSAAANATTATSTANTAATAANNAASRVENAISGATTAADEATKAADAADDATAAANQAAQGANASARAATDAAQGATQSEALATTAANRADAAAHSIEGATISQVSIPYGDTPNATLTKNADGTYHIGLEAERGPQGVPFLIKGEAYATVAALTAAVKNPQEGDQYNVGSAAPFNIYRWTGTYWQDQGVLQGPAGETGATGAQGPAGEDGQDGLTTSVNGVEQVDGNVTLTGNDVPMSGTDSTSLTAAIGEKARVMRRSAALAVAAWSSAAPYTQVVSVSGMTATMVPHCDVVLSDDNDVAESEKEAWGCVDKVESGANRLTVTCLADKPEVALNMQIEVVY